MRYLLLSFAFWAVVLCLPSALFSADHNNIAGVWRLDTSNNPSVDGRPVTSGTLMVTYQKKMLDTSETFNFPDGERNLSRNWKVDHHYHPVLGDGSGQVLAKWEGSTLTADHETGGAHESFRLSLSPDGRTLTETILRPDGSSAMYLWRR
jgi:hypothetical protein